MCVAIYKPTTSFGPSDRMLKHLWMKNKDGAGFCVIRNIKGDPITGPNEVPVVMGFKGFMDKDEFIEQYRSIVGTEDAALIHLRITTHGGTHPGGTHPFPATTDTIDLNATHWQSRFGIVHNGTIAGYGSRVNGALSDTQEFIQKILHDRIVLFSMFSNRNSAADEFVRKELGNSRIAVLRSDGKLVTYGTWHKAGNCLYSNTDFKGISPKDNRKAIRTRKFMKKLSEDSDDAKGFNNVNNTNVTGTTTEEALRNQAALKNCLPACLKPEDVNIDRKLIHSQYDCMLERMVPHHTVTGERLDYLIRCPTCNRLEGDCVVYKGMECCSICARDMAERNVIKMEDIQTEAEEEYYTAKELAKPERKSKKIRKILRREHGLRYCIELDLFIPSHLCLECGYNCVSEDNGKDTCYALDSMKATSPKLYEKAMQNIGDAFCFVEAETLEELGGDKLVLNWNSVEEEEAHRSSLKDAMEIWHTQKDDEEAEQIQIGFPPTCE